MYDKVTNLNEGAGNDWAGQVKLKDDFSSFFVPSKQSEPENLGAVLPTGS